MNRMIGKLCCIEEQQESGKGNSSHLDCVVIPQADLDKLEDARLSLHKLLKDKLSNAAYAELCFEVTTPMYKLTHKKYEKVVS